MRCLTALLCGLFLLAPATAPAQLFKDNDARKGVEELRGRLNEIESSLQVRQMGLGEQIQSVREDMAVLQSMIEENRHENGQLSGNIDVTRIETQEALVQLNRSYQERFDTVDENDKRLLAALEDFRRNLATLGQNLQTMSDFEKAQEERIAANQQQLQQQIAVVVDEVGQENLRLQNSISALRQDIADITDAVNTLDGRVRGLDSAIREVRRQQDAVSRPAATAVEGEHVVEKGETLATIAQMYGVTIGDITAANGLSNPNLINIGQVLLIPAP